MAQWLHTEVTKLSTDRYGLAEHRHRRMIILPFLVGLAVEFTRPVSVSVRV
jgi:hypothetical protein